MTRRRAEAFILALTLLLCGAARAMGDEIAPVDLTLALYYPADDMASLRPIGRTVTWEAGQTRAECAVRALIEAPPEDDALPAAPAGTRLLSIREADGAVVVDLSLEARTGQGPRSLFLLREAVARTLWALREAEYVDVLVAGRAIDAFSAPMGCATEVWGEGADAAWTRLSSREGVITCAAVIYRPIEDRLIFRVEDITFEGDPAPALLERVAPGVADGAEALILEDGRRVMRVMLDEGVDDGLCAAVTCTLMGFIPDVDGVQLISGGEALASWNGEALDQGVLTYAMCEDTIADAAMTYEVDAEGALRAVTRPMSHGDYCSPRARLWPLFDGAESPMPRGTDRGDILGVKIADGAATVDFSMSFYAACQALTPQGERNVVYAVTNTLAQWPGVRRVYFLFEGREAPALGQTVRLDGGVLPDAGIDEAPH